MIQLNVRVTSAGLLVNSKKNLRAIMRKAGTEVAAAAKKEIRGATAGGRTYRGSGGNPYRGGYRSGPYTASSPGRPPANITGTLLRSIAVRPFKSGEGVAVRARVFYALFLQVGAKGGGKGKASRNRRGKATSARVLVARPFLSTALDSRSASLGTRIRDAIVSDIAFVRAKAR